MKRKKVWKIGTDKLLLLSIMLFLCLGLTAQAQQVTVKGTVAAEEDGLPIPGVTVMVKGTTTGTITDIDGNFVIQAKTGDVLRFSFVGMKDLETKVEKTEMKVKMASDVIGLNEVVAIGYGTVKKKELTGAVAQVKSEDISKTVTADVATALQGLVAGVNVTASSGQPGEGSDILIRGVSSIDGNNTPLFVVDGVPQEGDPRLSPSEIETIDILKDASSCAIYGTRGAAGVILITTKKGEAGSLKVNVNGSYGIQDIRSGTPLLNAVDQTYADFLYQRNLSNIKDDLMNLPTLRSPYLYQNDTDLSGIVFIDQAPTQNYNINISGGSKDITYSVVGGYYKQDGVIINSGFERYNARANTTYAHGKWRINANIGATREQTDRPPGGIITQTIKYHPTLMSVDPNSQDEVDTYHGFESTNIGWVMESLKMTDTSNRHSSFINFNINYELAKGLSLSTRLGSTASNDYRHRFRPFTEVYDVNNELVGDPMADSYVIMDASRNTALTWEGGVNYKKTFGDHSLTLLFTQSLEEYLYDSFEAQKYGVTNSKITTLDGAVAASAATSNNNNYKNKLLGTIGRVQYDYKSKYLFSASVRRDGSSKFAKENRWGVFPSASAAWNISDEAFWKSFKKIANNFKLRASYGTVGNQSFKPYSFSAGIAQAIDYNFGDNQLAYGSAQASFANGNVKWETSVQSNLGVDLSFLKSKITFSAEYYNTNKKDMLMPIQLAPSTGSIPDVNLDSPHSSVVFLNVGDMTNKGLEMSLGYRGKIGQMKWRLNGTFSTNANKVTKINGLGGFTLLDDAGLMVGRRAVSEITAIAEGYEAGAFFIYRTDGIIDTQDKLTAYQQINPNARMGDLIYVDQATVDTDGDGVADAGDGKITNADRVYAGSGLPKYEAGLNFSADYKGFDFSMQWYSAIGHEIMNGAKATAYGWGRHRDLLYQWSEVNPTSQIPAYRGEPNSHPNYAGYTDLWLEDGSYLRLKEVTLGYSLPKKAIDKLGLGKCRIYVTAQNPITFTKYSGYDPEVGGDISSKGLDKGNYPVTSLYTVGFNLNF